MRLRILGASLTVVFEGRVSPAQRALLRRAWSRCLEDGEGTASAERGDGDCTGGDSPGGDGIGGDGIGGAVPFRARILTGSGVVPVAGGTFARFAAELTSALTFAAIERRSGELLMLHASGLADPGTGRTVALVGPSGVGKTTATRALANELGYVSDETVGVEPSGAVVPYAKPLSLIVEEPPAPKRQLGPDELGLRRAPSEGRLGAVVLLERRASRPGGRAEVRRLGHAEAIVGLAPHTSSIGKLRAPLQQLCRMLDACGGAVRAVYSEADELAGLIPGLLARPAVAGGWEPAVVPYRRADDGALAPVDQPPAILPRGYLRRGDVVDAVEIAIPDGGSDLLVMVGQQVVRLGGIAPAIWRALRAPARIEALAERIAPEVGLPPGYAGALSHAVEELSNYGVLLRS